jgi:diguanylate cyclase
MPTERRHARRFAHNLVAVSTALIHTIAAYYAYFQDWVWVSINTLHAYFSFFYVVNMGILIFVRSLRVMKISRHHLVFYETLWAVSYFTVTTVFFVDLRLALILPGLLSLGFAAFRLSAGYSWILMSIFCTGYIFGFWVKSQFDIPLENMSKAFIETVILLMLSGGFVIMGQAMAKLRRANKAKTNELKSALSRLETIAVQDDLTNVYNRKHIVDVINRFISLYSRNRTTFTICYIDVDSFRNINESFGHQAGDEVLIQIGRIAAEASRDCDVFGRFGGEEFVLVLPSTDIHGAVVLAKRLNKMVKDIRFNSIHYMLQVTVSIGVAEIKANETVEQFISRAEKALLEAKKSGRDKVCCATQAKI